MAWLEIDACVELFRKPSEVMPFSASVPAALPDDGATATNRSEVIALTAMSSAARSVARSETPAMVLVLNWTRLSAPPTEEPPEVLPNRKPSVPTLPAASINAVVVVAAIWRLAL
ncbi:hypothetical protein ACVW0J_007783 [Bradyrhizobium sp. i1.7.7]